MPFITPEIEGRFGFLTREEADKVSYGIVKLSQDGTIQLFNKYCCDMAGIAASDAEGKHFFSEVAPCTNNRLVYGKFRDGIAQGELNAEFPYTFTYKIRPTNVTLHLLYDAATLTQWIFIKRRNS